MKKQEKKCRKVNNLIKGFTLVWLLVLVSVVSILRVTFHYPSVLLYSCMIPLYFLGLYLFQKYLEHSPWAQNFEQLNEECELQENRQCAATRRPNVRSIILIALFGFIYALINAVDVVQEILSYSSRGVSYKEILPQCVDVLTLFLCCAFIAAILFNVLKGKVFCSRNVQLIYGVGVVLIFSTLLQIQCWGVTDMVPNYNVQLYYILFGAFIIFFGKLFGIAVKLKEEQDLTI